MEKSNGHTHQLDKEIGNKGNIDTGTQMQQYPVSQIFYRYATDEEYQLSKQNKINKTNVLVIDTNIYQSLGKERENELD
jgi:hypothetical protein